MTSYRDIVDRLEREDILEPERAFQVREGLAERLSRPGDSRLIAVVAGVGAWVAALFVLGCLFSLTVDVIGRTGLLIYTVVFASVAIFVDRSDHLQGVFVRQMTLALSAAAQLVAPFALSDAPILATIAVQLGLSCTLYVTVSGRANRVISSAVFITVAAVLLGMESLAGYFLVFGLCLGTAGAVFALEREIDWTYRRLLRPAAYVCVVAALLMSVDPLVAELESGAGLDGYQALIMRGITGFVAFGLVGFELVDDDADDQVTLLLGLAVVFFLGVVTSSGVFVSLLVAALGFWKLNRVLIVLGGLGLTGHLSVYYYQLDLTLLEKSGLLILCGLVLLALRWWHLRRAPTEAT